MKSTAAVVLPKILLAVAAVLSLPTLGQAQVPSEPGGTPANVTVSSIPTAHGVDHFGVTVPDLEQAVTFFQEVLGAELLWKLPASGLPGDAMSARYRVDPRARIALAMLRLGPNTNVELLQFQVPVQRVDMPGMEEVGAPYLGFYVDDVARACTWLEQHGCTLLKDADVPPGSPQESQHGRFVATPVHLMIKVLSRPAHLPYEKDTKARLAGPASAWTENGNGTAAVRLPTAHNLDHVGFNVPNLKVAIRYFVDVLGAELLWTDHPITDGHGTRTVAMLRCGPNLNVELAECLNPAGEPIGHLRPNSDVDAGHLAFYVDDIIAAATYLADRGGTTVLAGPNLDDGPASGKRGESHRYFLTPWGSSLELVQRPAHLPYETSTASRLAPLPAGWKP